MHQAVHATQIDEGTEVDDAGDNTLDLALGELVEEVCANLRLGLLKPCTTGQNNVVTVLVEFNDLSFELAANVRLQVADATHLNEGCRQEATQTDVED